MATLNVFTPSDYANGIPELWDPQLRFDAAQKQKTKKLEGTENSKMPIIRQDDCTKKAGDTIHFDTLGVLYGDGRTMAQTLEGYEEKPTLGQFDLTFSSIRHATAMRKDTNKYSLFKLGEWARPQLAEWFARHVMDNGAFNAYVSEATARNKIYSGEATAVTNLATLAGDFWTLTVADYIKGKAILQSMGAAPFEVTNEDGEEYAQYGAFIDGFSAYHLQNDNQYTSLNEAAFQGFGKKSPILRGAMTCIRGMYGYEIDSMRGWGSPLRPECKVYGSHAIDASTITVGSDTTGVINYTKYFDSAGTLSIINDSGNVEYVTYTAKTNYSFTGCTRGVTYGDRTSTAVAYTGGINNQEYVTQNHFEANVILFGAQSLMRGFAMTESNIEQSRDYGNEKGIGIEAILGHKTVKDSAGANKNYVILKTCAIPWNANVS